MTEGIKSLFFQGSGWRYGSLAMASSSLVDLLLILTITYTVARVKGGALLQGRKIGFCSLLREEDGRCDSRCRRTAMETWEELGRDGLGRRCRSGVMLTFLS